MAVMLFKGDSKGVNAINEREDVVYLTPVNTLSSTGRRP